MILTPKIVARLVVVALLGVLLQLTFFSQVQLFHVSPDVLPALVVSLGLLGGTMTGAGRTSGLTWKSCTWEKKVSCNSTPSSATITNRATIFGVRITGGFPQSAPEPC